MTPTWSTDGMYIVSPMGTRLFTATKSATRSEIYEATAAPDLYEACKAMYRACATDAVRRVLGKEYGEAFGLARAALAKADGKRHTEARLDAMVELVRKT